MISPCINNRNIHDCMLGPLVWKRVVSQYPQINTDFYSVPGIIVFKIQKYQSTTSIILQKPDADDSDIIMSAKCLLLYKKKTNKE